PEENDADQRHDNAFFDQFLAQCRDGAANQIAAIVNRHDAHTGRQGRLYLYNFLFYCIDDVECVFAVAHYDDAANDLAASVELSNTTPDVTTEMDVSNIL